MEHAFLYDSKMNPLCLITDIQKLTITNNAHLTMGGLCSEIPFERVTFISIPQSDKPWFYGRVTSCTFHYENGTTVAAVNAMRGEKS